MNIYDYMAASNPLLVRALIKKYGHALNQNANLGLALKQLVAIHQEPVLIEIIENHPDKELFEDYFGGKKSDEAEKKLGCNGGCAGCSGRMEKTAFVGFAGAPQAVAETKEASINTSVIMLASSVLIAFAILMTPRK